jgi:hypothetical protein
MEGTQRMRKQAVIPPIPESARDETVCLVGGVHEGDRENDTQCSANATTIDRK